MKRNTSFFLKIMNIIESPLLVAVSIYCCVTFFSDEEYTRINIFMQYLNIGYIVFKLFTLSLKMYFGFKITKSLKVLGLNLASSSLFLVTAYFLRGNWFVTHYYLINIVILILTFESLLENNIACSAS